MRVISGKLKGRVIEGDNILGTRPTQARIKESLFAMIQDRVVNSVVLDLFAGSGALGIEAISMGCSMSYFVDHQSKAYNIINKNISNLDIKDYSKIYKQEYSSFLKNIKEKFDIVFLDPPYDTDYIDRSIKLLLEYDLLNKDALIVCESSDMKKIPNNDKLKLRKERKYGDKYIVIFEKI